MTHMNRAQIFLHFLFSLSAKITTTLFFRDIPSF